jgi:hypothetical protein
VPAFQRWEVIVLKSSLKARGASGFEEGAPLFTVGDLRAELVKWDDDTVITFRSPLQQQEFRFYRFVRLSRHRLEIAINRFPETPVVKPTLSQGRRKEVSQTDVGSTSRVAGRHAGRVR